MLGNQQGELLVRSWDSPVDLGPMESVARTSGNVSHPSTVAWLSSTLHSYPNTKRYPVQSLKQRRYAEPFTKPTKKQNQW